MDANGKPYPVGEFDPLSIQKDPLWYPPSCLPSSSLKDAPLDGSNGGEGSAIAGGSIAARKKRVAVIVATAVGGQTGFRWSVRGNIDHDM